MTLFANKVTFWGHEKDMNLGGGETLFNTVQYFYVFFKLNSVI